MAPWDPISKIQTVETPLGQTIQLNYKEKESKNEMEGEALG